MLNFCGIVVAILKMAFGRNFSMSGHHYELIPDIEKFLPVAIFKIVTTIPQKNQHFPISSKLNMSPEPKHA
jgi:hypothetical protein